MAEKQDEFDKLTYEQKIEKLDKILSRLDNSETPIDELAEDVKLIFDSFRCFSRIAPNDFS